MLSLSDGLKYFFEIYIFVLEQVKFLLLEFS